MKPRRRVLKGVLIVLGVLAVAVIAVLSLERVRGQRAFADWEREVRARGQRLTIKELTSPPLTNREVQVLTPTEAVGVLNVGSLPAEFPARMRLVAPGKARVIWRQADFVDRRGERKSWDALRPSLEALRLELPQLRHDLTNGTFIVRPDYESGFDLLLPHLSAAKSAGTVLAGMTLFELREDHRDTALDNLLACVALVETMRDERLVINQLVRIALGAIAYGASWELLQARQWNDQELEALQMAWTKLDFTQGMAGGLEIERAMAAPYFDRGHVSDAELIRTLDASLLGLGGPSGNAPESDLETLFEPLLRATAGLRLGLRIQLWRFAWASHDKLLHHRVMQSWIDTARRSGREGRWRPDGLLTWRELETSTSGWNGVRYLLTPQILPALQQTVSRAAMQDVCRDLCVTAIALERYRLRQGTYPDRLDDLVPELLSAVPQDLFSNGPLRYACDANGTYQLYSVGEDGVDDGGDTRSTDGSMSNLLRARDLVWCQAATPAEVAEYERKREE